ncbi:hypothetical protein [Streptodolium elevatio]|uniref:DUF3298 domain-containing protein n=1 Tax=Streptodolium elevatio TaxID=3157996 RepID=A0ABV3DEC0_9ACTN
MRPADVTPAEAALGNAARLLREELLRDGRPLRDLVAQDAWKAFLRFARIPFDTPGTTDCDGLPFQYGTYAFDGPPTFLLDFTRQFESVDEHGGHESRCTAKSGSPPPRR